MRDRAQKHAAHLFALHINSYVFALHIGVFTIKGKTKLCGDSIQNQILVFRQFFNLSRNFDCAELLSGAGKGDQPALFGKAWRRGIMNVAISNFFVV